MTTSKRPDRPGPGSAAAFFRQLHVSVYVADMRPAPPRVAARPVARNAGSPPPAHRAPAPCVLLISRARDGEFDLVANLLGRVGVTAARINADELTGADLLVDPARRVVRVGGRWLAPTVAWSRHFSAQAIEGGGGRTHDLFVRESWGAIAGEIVDISATGIRSGRPGQLAQLRLAERHGIAVPRTVLTTDPYQAKERLRGPKLVIKAAHRHFVEPAPGSLTAVFPAIVARDGLTPLPRPGPPVVVQEYVEHDAELRVYYVSGQVHGFRVVKDAPADIWLHDNRVRAGVVDLGPEVVRAARSLATALAMRFCVFDFLVRDDSPVFLELDPAGDWRWIESKAGVAPVTMAVVRMLCDLHRANRPAAAAENATRADPFDLLAFLSGRAPIDPRVNRHQAYPATSAGERAYS